MELTVSGKVELFRRIHVPNQTRREAMPDVKLESMLSNDKVEVTKVTLPVGWVGEHTHPVSEA